jgi:hypothetical protein
MGAAATFRLARRGRCEPPEPHRGVILGTVSGTRFEGRKARERGSRAAPGDSGLVRSQRNADRPVLPPVPSGAFVCAARAQRRRGSRSGGPAAAPASSTGRSRRPGEGRVDRSRLPEADIRPSANSWAASGRSGLDPASSDPDRVNDAPSASDQPLLTACCLVPDFHGLGLPLARITSVRTCRVGRATRRRLSTLASPQRDAPGSARLRP